MEGGGTCWGAWSWDRGQLEYFNYLNYLKVGREGARAHCSYNILIAGTDGSIRARLEKEKGDRRKHKTNSRERKDKQETIHEHCDLYTESA